LKKVKPKTEISKGGPMRLRWKDDDGTIYEWDSQHGRLEKYDSRGRHLGEFDVNSGEQTKGADKKRRVTP
jgi:hypothetical protein